MHEWMEDNQGGGVWEGRSRSTNQEVPICPRLSPRIFLGVNPPQFSRRPSLAVLRTCEHCDVAPVHVCARRLNHRVGAVEQLRKDLHLEQTTAAIQQWSACLPKVCGHGGAFTLNDSRSPVQRVSNQVSDVILPRKKKDVASPFTNGHLSDWLSRL
jgi:hypothetical protein